MFWDSIHGVRSYVLLIAQVSTLQCRLICFLTGIGRSLPRVSFFETPAERALWGSGALHVLNKSTGGIAHEWARSKVTNQLAEERQIDVLRHINTDQTARDMLRITEAHGKEKLQYWGFSYVPCQTRPLIISHHLIR